MRLEDIQSPLLQANFPSLEGVKCILTNLTLPSKNNKPWNFVQALHNLFSWLDKKVWLDSTVYVSS